MNRSVQNEVMALIKNLDLKCTIKEFSDKVNWICISEYQKLSEPFIKEFKDKVHWNYISICQKLSESFIREFKDKVDWDYISKYQKLSEQFIREFSDKLNRKVQIQSNHDNRSKLQKLQEIKLYAKQHNLKLTKTCLYAFRNHDFNGCGSFNKTICYKPNKYYKDWHCDLNPNNANSFGLGIWPKGNTKVKVRLDDWGTAVKGDEDGKARVWGFEIVK